MEKNTLAGCREIKLPRIHYRAGNITAVEALNTIPGKIERVFYVYDIPAGATRGGHAHHQCHQFIVAVAGSFEVKLDDGHKKKSFQLHRPDVALHVPPGIWNNLLGFSSGAICLVLATEAYNEDDYIRNYADYISLIKSFPK